MAFALISPVLAEEVAGGRKDPFAGVRLQEDLYGDPLPEEAVLRLGTSRLRHDVDICCIAFSPDGRRLATGSSGAIVFWDPTTGKKSGQISAPEFKRTSTLEFSPDGTQIALGAADFLRVWRVADGEPVFAQMHPPGNVRGVAFVSEGRMLAAIGGDAQVRLWDIAEGAEKRVLETGFAGNDRTSLVASRDGRWLAASCGTSICIWDIDSGKRLASIQEAHRFAVRSLVFSADGRTLISNGVDTLEVPGDNPLSRALGTFSQVRKWDTQTGRLTGEMLSADADPIADMAPTSDGERLLAATYRGLLELDLKSGALVRRIQLPNRWLNGVHDEMAASPDGRLLGLVSGNKAVHLVELTTGDLFFPSATEATLAVAFSRDGSRVVTGSQDGTVRLWNAVTGGQLLLLSDATGFTNLLDVAFSPSGSLIAACGDYSPRTPVGMVGVVKVWNATSGELIYEQLAEGHLFGTLAFSADGRMLAAADGFGPLVGNRTVPPQVCVFRAESGAELLALPSHAKSIAAMAFTADNSFLICVGGGMVGGKDARIWSLPSGELIETLATGDLSAAAISRDATTLLTCVQSEEDSVLSVMDLTSGMEVRELGPSLCRSGTRRVLAVSPDGQVLAAGCADGPILIWERETGREICEIRAPEATFRSVAFSPQADRLVTGMNDGTAIVWDLQAR